MLRRYRRERVLACRDKYGCSFCWKREKLPTSQFFNFECLREEWETRDTLVPDWYSGGYSDTTTSTWECDYVWKEE